MGLTACSWVNFTFFPPSVSKRPKIVADAVLSHIPHSTSEERGVVTMFAFSVKLLTLKALHERFIGKSRTRVEGERRGWDLSV